jgi:hypothetical protein
MSSTNNWVCPFFFPLIMNTRSVQVGSNAQEIRQRLWLQQGLVFRQYRRTNHYYAPFTSDGRRVWVTTLDAFVDCQLRASEDLRATVRMPKMSRNEGPGDWGGRSEATVVGRSDCLAAEALLPIPTFLEPCQVVPPHSFLIPGSESVE